MVHLSTKVLVYHCKGHQKGSTEVARGTQAADQAAKRAALQGSDLNWVATLVSQTNLPETPSYTEGETLKTKSECFEENHMGWFQKERLLFLPGNLHWKLVDSLHATTHLGKKTSQRLLKKVLQRNGSPNNYKATGILLFHLTIKDPQGARRL